ncbi:MAG: hypothetical protein K2X86_18895 [Cytophagaceae bacterium]|nr:hypothetical protein [Cytophagaceae bacterium]
MSCDKLQKTKDERHINILIDHIIKSKRDLNYLYFEIPVNSDYKDPSYIKRDLGTMGLQIPYKILYLIFKFLGWHKKKSKILSDGLNDHFTERKVNYSIDPAIIRDHLIAFSAEYHIYNFLLFFIKPKAAFVVDQGAAGKVGAFLNNKVNVIEVQHGMIEEFSAAYVYAASRRPRKNQLVIANKVCVFGDFHKRALLKYGYWQDSEVICLGNYRVDYWRKHAPVKNNAKFSILFPTQWHTFEETKEFFSSFLSSCLDNVIIHVKLHPAEKEGHISFYQELVKKHSDKIFLWDKSKDIYELIIASELVVSFDSTTLLEALALGKLCATIPTEAAPLGIHSYMNTTELVDIIKVLKDASDLIRYIYLIRQDPEYAKHWQEESLRLGEYLYSPDYSNRCYVALNDLIKDESPC